MAKNHYINYKVSVLIVSLALLGLGQNSFADNNLGITSRSNSVMNRSNFYFGVQGGYAMIDDGSAVEEFILANNVPVKTSSTQTGNKIFFGYTQNFWSFEIGGTWYPDKDYLNICKVKMWSGDLIGKYTFPFGSNGLYGYVKLGLSNGFTEFTFTDCKWNMNDFGIGYGLGLEFQVNNRLSIDLAWSGLLSLHQIEYNKSTGSFVLGNTTYDINDGSAKVSSYIPSATMLAIGVTFKF